MTARYIARRAKLQTVVVDPMLSVDEDAPHLPSLTVDMCEPTATGILDKDGNEFMRMPERIGYVRF